MGFERLMISSSVLRASTALRVLVLHFRNAGPSTRRVEARKLVWFVFRRFNRPQM